MLFYRDGIHATGVESIIQHARVSKRTLYRHFSSKDELVEDYLRNLDRCAASPMEQGLNRTDLSPRERLLAVFAIPPTGRFRGCPFHNAAVESAGEWATVEDIVRAHKRRFADAVVAVARLTEAADPYILGQQILVLLEGATSLATSLNDSAPLAHARAAAVALIDAAEMERLSE